MGENVIRSGCVWRGPHRGGEEGGGGDGSSGEGGGHLLDSLGDGGAGNLDGGSADLRVRVSLYRFGVVGEGRGEKKFQG